MRDPLATGVVVTRGLDGCLFVLTAEEWKRFTAQLGERFSFTNRDARALTRFFFASATSIIPDRQGRILIPPFLREYAGLQSEVVITGANNRVELWDPERWRETIAAVESNAEDIAEQFSNFTF
jgi:MraZ protein